MWEEDATRIHADITLIEAARHLALVIREYNAEAERERRLSPPVLAALHDAGLLRMCTPRSLGGLEVDPLTRALVIEEISGHDTAAGWTLANPLDQAYLCARLPDAGAEEIYSRGANVVIAGRFGLPMQATPAQGGYRITGRAPFVSNCYDATWIATEAAVLAGDHAWAADKGEPAVVMACLPRDRCHVVDTWHVMGMRGTGSHDVTVTDVFVPTARTFPFVPEFTPGSHYQGPLYRFPFIGIAASALPPVLPAVARQAIEEVSGLAQGKVPVATSTVFRGRASVHATLAQAEALLRAARLWLSDPLREAREAPVAGEPLARRHKAGMRRAIPPAVRSAVQAVELMYSAAGTGGISTRSPLERYVRDGQALRHPVAAAETRDETVGQVHLGLPPNLPALTCYAPGAGEGGRSGGL